MVETPIEQPKPAKKHSSDFEKGHIPWNKGMTWSQMGMNKRKQNKLRKNLEKGRKFNEEARRKAQEANARRMVPIVAIKDGKEFFFECSQRFAEKVGTNANNVRRAYRHGWKVKGWVIKRFDDYEK